MNAELLMDEQHVLDARSFVEIVVWRLPRPARGSLHRFKYRLALVVDGVCVLRYDNETGKGDHRHVTGKQGALQFRRPGYAARGFLARSPGMELMK